MPRGNRTLKGNKRRATFDKLIVPENGYRPPVQIRPIYPEQPTEPVGQRCTITHVVVYEMYITYEGRPATEIHRVPFSNIVGNPIDTVKMRFGYDLQTKQGEVITLKWHHNDGNYSRSGLMLNNKSAAGTSFYEPNWGNVYGVGLEWLACDGSQSGTIWANRHLGYCETFTNTGGETYPQQTYWTNPPRPDYSPRAVRGGLMLGNPSPDRAMWLMGQDLPIRVYPALGKIGEGVFLGFNQNVMNFVKVAPPAPTFFELSGEGTSRGDMISIRWQKSEFHDTYVRCGFELVSDPMMIVRNTTPNMNPNNRNVTLSTQPTLARSGNGGISMINFFTSLPGDSKFRFYLFECDAAGNPLYTLEALEAEWQWPAGSSTCPVPKKFVRDNLPYPFKEVEMCQGMNPPDPGPVPEPSEGYKYFCDNSVSPSSVNTNYWVGDKALDPQVAASIQAQYGVTINQKFWEGRNNWIDLFIKVGTDVPIQKSKITPSSFQTYYWKMLVELLDGTGDLIEASNWDEFKFWCNQNGLTCLTDLQKASLYMSYILEVPVNFFPSASGYLQGNILDTMASSLAALPKGVYDWIDFNDVIVDSQGSITGAFAMDFPVAELSALSSFINFEPEALQYGIDTAIGHRPIDYIKPMGIAWGTPTAVNWQSYWLPDMTAQNYRGFVAAEVGIHELGHCISNHGLDVYGIILHEMPDWLNISGWDPQSISRNPSDVRYHLVKSRSADQTGGTPLTDSGYEAPVSDYGCFHPAEDFADAYRMYVVNPVFMAAKYPQKYNFMVTKVETMF